MAQIDIEKKVSSCLHKSRKRFGSVVPDGWSDSDSNSDFENDPGAANKRLSLRCDSKRFKLAKRLNLDLGIETCFIDGLNGYWKTWLQFVFPAYIWIITAVIIVVAHYSSTGARLFGNNSVQVLAYYYGSD